MKTYNVDIDVVFESKKPMTKPSWMSCDGFTVNLKDGTTVVFDTIRYDGNFKVLEDGRIEFSFSKSEFDVGFFKDSNEEYFSTRSKEEPPEWSEILSGDFTELHIIGDSVEDKPEDIRNTEMLITEVVFSLYGKNGEHEEVKLTKEQIETLNKNIESTYVFVENSLV